MPEPDAALIDAVVVYALPARAHLFEVRIRAGSSVRVAIEASGLLSTVPELAGKPLDVGIFGRCCRLEDPVRDGDRIEVYRPLTADPKVARRRRALLKSE
jgi:putative ubiquitin-RnfH superfamily antitoxin RatB of RatAB toxin-antitoxin module